MEQIVGVGSGCGIPKFCGLNWYYVNVGLIDFFPLFFTIGLTFRYIGSIIKVLIRCWGCNMIICSMGGGFHSTGVLPRLLLEQYPHDEIRFISCVLPNEHPSMWELFDAV
jgi:hypothetical protein